MPIFVSIGFHSAKYRGHHYSTVYRCSLLIKLNKQSIFWVFDFSGRGFCADIAKQAIVYCEFNRQTGEVTLKKSVVPVHQEVLDNMLELI